jgi:hypothetical protein
MFSHNFCLYFKPVRAHILAAYSRMAESVTCLEDYGALLTRRCEVCPFIARHQAPFNINRTDLLSERKKVTDLCSINIPLVQYYYGTLPILDLAQKLVHQYY